MAFAERKRKKLFALYMENGEMRISICSFTHLTYI